MARKANIVRYSAEVLAERRSQTDWAKVDATGREAIERQADEDDGPLSEGWEETIVLGTPEAKQDVHIRLDRDVLRWFKADGRGYQTRINAVLRAFVQVRRQADAAAKDQANSTTTGT